MSNRKITKAERIRRAYRSEGGPVVHTDGQGNIRRGQGRNNFAYGPLTTSPSILTLHRQAERARRVYGTPDYSAMTRDDLRKAAREAGVEGWHKMNKAGLVAALTTRSAA